MLECVDISKTYNKGSWFSRKKGSDVLKGVSFKMSEGRSLGLIGENGSGKSTLTRILLGLEEPSGGNVFFEKNDIHAMVRSGKKYFRRNMQAVFQNPAQAMNPRYTAFQVIAEPLYNFADNMDFFVSDNSLVAEMPKPVKAVPVIPASVMLFFAKCLPSRALKEEIREKVKKLMCDVGLDAHDIDKNINQFSGGQQQRICIARALALNPKLLILDEAVSNLDMVIQSQIIELLQHLKRSHDISLFVISHDIRIVFNLCEDILVLSNGIITDRLSIEDGLDISMLQAQKQTFSRQNSEIDNKNAISNTKETNTKETNTKETNIQYSESLKRMFSYE